MNALLIDAFEFCRLKERREGEIPVADMPRLAKESVDHAGVLRWTLQGGKDKLGHPQLTVSVAAPVTLICQRCLAPFVFDIASESVLVLAPDEASANEMDALLEDEAVETIVGSRDFNVAELLEDEALLMIPVSPKHEVCDPLPVSEGAVSDEKVSPFAVLKNLKR